MVFGDDRIGLVDGVEQASRLIDDQVLADIVGLVGVEDAVWQDWVGHVEIKEQLLGDVTYSQVTVLKVPD